MGVRILLDHNQHMTTISRQTVYYLPGFGGQLATGLGQGLMDRGFDVTGRETRGDFRDLPISGTSVRKRILAWTLTPVWSIRLSAP